MYYQAVSLEIQNLYDELLQDITVPQDGCEK